MKLFSALILLLFVFVSVCFQTAATAHKNPSSLKVTQSNIVDKKVSSTVQCSKDELESLRYSVERALVGDKTRKIKKFVYELNAIGVTFALCFEINNNTSEFLNSCSIVKYYRENIRRIMRTYMTIYFGSKRMMKYHYGVYFYVIDHNDLKEKACKSPVFRKPQIPHKVKPVKTVLSERILDMMSYLQIEYLYFWQDGYWPMDLFHMERDKLQLLIKCDHFKENKFRLFIKSKYTADYGQLDYKVLLHQKRHV